MVRLAQGRNKCQGLHKTLMKLRPSQNAEKLLSIICQKVLCFMGLVNPSICPLL